MKAFRGLKGRKVVGREGGKKGDNRGDIMTRRGDRPRSLKTNILGIPVQMRILPDSIKNSDLTQPIFKET